MNLSYSSIVARLFKDQVEACPENERLLNRCKRTFSVIFSCFSQDTNPMFASFFWVILFTVPQPLLVQRLVSEGISGGVVFAPLVSPIWHALTALERLDYPYYS